MAFSLRLVHGFASVIRNTRDYVLSLFLSLYIYRLYSNIYNIYIFVLYTHTRVHARSRYYIFIIIRIIIVVYTRVVFITYENEFSTFRSKREIPYEKRRYLRDPRFDNNYRRARLCIPASNVRVFACVLFVIVRITYYLSISNDYSRNCVSRIIYIYNPPSPVCSGNNF